jgi:regulator of protease activity HflC (stomatin/prohibitin superfamily)
MKGKLVMISRSKTGITILALGTLALGTGCAGATIQPGHRALYFDPGNGGIQHEVLQPGWYQTACPFWIPGNKCPRVDDFDVTYSTSKEAFHALSSEGLPLDLQIAVSYRPIVAELYALDTEIGPNYFDEVIGPEFRSAAIGVFAHTSYADLQKQNGIIEDDIEKALRDRLRGKHVEISSVLIEKVTYAPEIMQSQKERVVSQEETLKNKQLLDNQAEQRKRELEISAATKKLELENAVTQKKMELAADAEQKKLTAKTDLEVQQIEIQKDTDEEKFKIDSELRNKQAEAKLTIEQAKIDKLKADAASATAVAKARGEAGARLELAKAEAAEQMAGAANITPLTVQMHAYDALGQLGGKGTTVMLGDWSKLPGWLFPKVPGFQSAFTPFVAWPATPGGAPGSGPTAQPPAKTTSYSPTDDSDPYK